MTDMLDDGEDLGNYTHNSEPDVLNASAQGRLRSFVERLERLNDDVDAIRQDIKEVKAEAKGEGFDVPVLMMVIKRRKADKAKLAETEAILDLYLAAIGEI